MIFRIGLILTFTFCSYITVRELSPNTKISISMPSSTKAETPWKNNGLLNELRKQKSVTLQSLAAAEGFAKHNNWLVSKTTLATVRRHLTIFTAESSPQEIDVIKADLDVLKDLLEKLQLSPTLHRLVNTLDSNLSQLKKIHHKHISRQMKSESTLPKETETSTPVQTSTAGLFALGIMWCLFIIQSLRVRSTAPIQQAAVVNEVPVVIREEVRTATPMTSNLVDIIEEAISTVSPEIQARGISIEVNGVQELQIPFKPETVTNPLENLVKLVSSLLSIDSKFESRLTLNLSGNEDKQVLSVRLFGRSVKEDLLSLKLSSGMSFESRLIEIESELGLRPGSLEVKNHYTYEGKHIFASIDVSFPKTLMKEAKLNSPVLSREL